MASSEALLISAVLQTADFTVVSGHGVNDGMFITHGDEFRYILRHVAKHGSVPSKPAFKAKFPDFTIYKVTETAAFCDDVKQEYARGAMSDLLDKSIDLLVKGSVDQAMEKLGTELLRIQATVQDVQEDYDLTVDWEATYRDVMARIDRVRKHGTAGVPTGFDTLDLATGGLQPGWFTIMAARLGVGKTWSMVHMATNAALSGYSAMYWSLEQSKHQIAMRTHTSMSRVLCKEPFRNRDLMRGHGFDLQEYKDFLGALDDKLQGRLVVNDTQRGGVGPMEIAASIERDMPDILFIDYITLLRMKGDGGWLSAADLSRSIQQVGQRYQVPIVAASQLNRAAIGNDDDPGTLSRTDSLGHDADLIVMAAKKSTSVRKFSIPKFRHGEDGQMWFVKWKVNTGDIEEISGDEAGTLIEQDNEVD